MQGYIKLVRYYIYVYLDLNKPGHYVTYTDLGKITFDHEPVYIGKGANNRMENHISQCKNKEFSEFLENNIFEHKKIYEDLPSHNAYLIENQLIFNIGRKDLKRGPLLNKSAGVNLKESTSDNIGPFHLEFKKLIYMIEIMNSTKTLKQASEILGISERSLHRLKNDYRLKKVEGSWVQIH